MKRKIVIAVLIVVVIVGVLAGIKGLQIKTLVAAGKAFVPPPETVSSFVARQEKWQNSLGAIGSVSAVQGVIITPEVPGVVREIAFESGAKVAKGDLLVRLDAASEEAQLRALEAQREWDRMNLARMQNLRKENTISQSELDAAEIAARQSQANADNLRAIIEKKTIRAPFAGRLGIRQVNLGEYLETTKPIVSLQAIDSVYADFSLPQQELALLKTGMTVRVFTDTYPDRQFEGKLTAINPDLDSVTRSVRLQATFENEEQLLRPGMFARVQVVLPGEQDVLVIPATSVLSAPYGDSVYIIEPKPAETNAPAAEDKTKTKTAASTNAAPALVVRQQFVRTGRARGDFVTVENGLKPGEKVASSGLFKLRNGMSVIENNEITPKPAEKPKPSDS